MTGQVKIRNQKVPYVSRMNESEKAICHSGLRTHECARAELWEDSNSNQHAFSVRKADQRLRREPDQKEDQTNLGRLRFCIPASKLNCKDSRRGLKPHAPKRTQKHEHSKSPQTKKAPPAKANTNQAHSVKIPIHVYAQKGNPKHTEEDSIDTRCGSNTVVRTEADKTVSLCTASVH